MRKTARPVVWEGAGAQSPALDPIDLVHRPAAKIIIAEIAVSTFNRF